MKFTRNDLKLKDDHRWTCSPGHRVVVLNRGAMRFEIPDGWIVVPTDHSLKIHDRQPPHDEFVIEASVMGLPRIERLDELPAAANLQHGFLEAGHYVDAEDLHEIDYPGMKVVWGEYPAFEIDPAQPGEVKREALWKQAFCYTHEHWGIITFGSWIEERERALTLWEHLLATLIMSQFIDDPRVGPQVH